MRSFAILFILLLLPASTLMAKSAQNSVHPRLQFGTGSHRAESPARDRQINRSFWLGGGAPISENWRGDVQFAMTHDKNKWSSRVRITEDRYLLTPLVGWSYTYYFRYTAHIGPAIDHYRTKVVFGGDRDHFTKTSFGIMAMGSIDYVIADNWEITGSAAWLERPADNKRDYLYTVHLSYVLSTVALPWL